MCVCVVFVYILLSGQAERDWGALSRERARGWPEGNERKKIIIISEWSWEESSVGTGGLDDQRGPHGGGGGAKDIASQPASCVIL